MMEYDSYDAVTPAKPTRSPQINCGGICGFVIIPSVVFVLLFSIATFWRFTYPSLYVAAFAGFFLIIAGVFSAEFEARARTQAAVVLGAQGKTLAGLMPALLLLAWLAAFALGMFNFRHNMAPWMEMKSMQAYVDVDPVARQGTQIADGGRVSFVGTAKLDITKSMVFRSLDSYCVAPIVNGMAPLAHYDFWAVGKNCCPGLQGTFQCGEWLNPKAHAGIRLIEKQRRNYYRLAVQQAEAAYKITAKHPLFFEWVQDPEQAAAEYQEKALLFFIYGISAFCAANVLLVLLTLICIVRNKPHNNSLD